MRFYLERMPPQVASTRAFERWWRERGAIAAAPARRARGRPPGAAAAVAAAARTTRRRSTSTATRCRSQYRFDTDCGRRRRDARGAAAVAAGARRAAARVADSRLAAREGHRAAARAAEGGPSRDRADPRRGGPPPRRACRRSAKARCCSAVAAFATQGAGIVVDEAQLAAVPLPPWLRFNLRVRRLRRADSLRESRDLQALREEFRIRVGAAPFGGSDARVGAQRRAPLGFR